MSAIVERQASEAMTGRASQQPQPSAHHASGFFGGYLRPNGGPEMRPADSSDVAANRRSTRASTSVDAPPSLAERIVPPVVPFPLRHSGTSLKPLQSWEGVVVEIHDDTFVARLFDRRRPGRPEEAEFPLSDVADGDLGLVAEGAIFYWSIGYLVTAGGQRTRTSTVRFRRLPVWTGQELRNARDRALEAQRLLDWA